MSICSLTKQFLIRNTMKLLFSYHFVHLHILVNSHFSAKMAGSFIPVWCLWNWLGATQRPTRCPSHLYVPQCSWQGLRQDWHPGTFAAGAPWHSKTAQQLNGLAALLPSDFNPQPEQHDRSYAPRCLETSTMANTVFLGMYWPVRGNVLYTAGRKCPYRTGLWVSSTFLCHKYL